MLSICKCIGQSGCSGESKSDAKIRILDYKLAKHDLKMMFRVGDTKGLTKTQYFDFNNNMYNYEGELLGEEAPEKTPINEIRIVSKDKSNMFEIYASYKSQSLLTIIVENRVPAETYKYDYFYDARKSETILFNQDMVSLIEGNKENADSSFSKIVDINDQRMKPAKDSYEKDMKRFDLTIPEVKNTYNWFMKNTMQRLAPNI